MRDPAKRTRRRFVSHQPNCSAGNSPGRPCSKMSVECKPQRGLRWLIWLGCFLLSFLARVSFQKNTVVWNCSTTRKMFWKNVRKVLLQPVQTADRVQVGRLVSTGARALWPDVGDWLAPPGSRCVQHTAPAAAAIHTGSGAVSRNRGFPSLSSNSAWLASNVSLN